MNKAYITKKSKLSLERLKGKKREHEGGVGWDCHHEARVELEHFRVKAQATGERSK